ncbi:Deacetylase [Vulgatibacter incomptus]|uniref:Deacetylase n=2 Tax=Vulgatibacter incomptus TaxID=1391653 RepID=A0A0K1PBA1_9BACT|nr:Deacetylase [Vulgatibacter incomptus]
MFRIRRIHDDVLQSNRNAIAQVQHILRAQFPSAPASDSESLPEMLRNPLKYRFRSILFVADDSRGRVKGFGLLLHAPDLGFCFLDFISAAAHRTGSGIGGALYQRLREEALALGCDGLFFECLPDEPALSPNPVTRAENVRRLRFYERFGARPLTETAYETPLTPGDTDPPYLVFDDLGSGKPLAASTARSVVRAILERKYGALCPREYVEMVVASFRDDPVRLRPPRYVSVAPAIRPEPAIPADERIALLVNEEHSIHHVRERGYVESPVRIRSIRRQLDASGLFEPMSVRHFGDRHVEAVHDRDFLEYLRRVCLKLSDQPIYPYVFPIRNAARPPRDLAVRAGYYCIDTFTPLARAAWLASRRAVDCALSAADELLRGRRLSYALVRPPGHHAERRSFGGFCYLNSTAIAAEYLSHHGKVAILDVDYHHGNGQQDIFYERPDVLTLSIHAHPREAYPYFSGFPEERGRGDGLGYNVNYALRETVDGTGFRLVLERALRRIRGHRPAFLVVALGLDTAKGDPTGSWALGAKDFEANGRMIGVLGIPTVVVQEGGYDTRVLGTNARRFFSGLWAGAHAGQEASRKPAHGAAANRPTETNRR